MTDQPTLPDTIREQRPEARARLEGLVALDDQITATRAVLDALIAKRRGEWEAIAEQLQVSWADLGRASRVSGVTVQLAVQGRNEPARNGGG